MTGFVLDNSVAMRWLLESPKVSDQKYAENVLRSLSGQYAVVPNLWHLEAGNVGIEAEKRGEITVGEAAKFTHQLENLPIHVDAMTAY